MKYYMFNLGDYAKATAHMCWLEKAIYVRLLNLYHDLEKPLTRDMKTLYRLVGTKTAKEEEAVNAVLEDLFDIGADGMWHNKECDRHITACTASKTNGSLGGRPRISI